MEIMGTIEFKSNSIDSISQSDVGKSVEVVFKNHCNNDDFILRFDRQCFESLVRLGILFTMNGNERVENPKTSPGRINPDITLWLSREPVRLEVEGVDTIDEGPPFFYVKSRHGEICFDFSESQAKALQGLFQEYAEIRKSMKEFGKTKTIQAKA